MSESPCCRIAGCPLGPIEHPVHSVRDIAWVGEELRIGDTCFTGVTFIEYDSGKEDETGNTITRSENFTFVPRHNL